VERPRACGYRPTPHCWWRAGRSQLWSASSFDVVVYAVVVVQAVHARPTGPGHTVRELMQMLAIVAAVVVLGLDSVNRSSDSPGLAAFVTG
jgi:hypothetical protein